MGAGPHTMCLRMVDNVIGLVEKISDEDIGAHFGERRMMRTNQTPSKEGLYDQQAYERMKTIRYVMKHK